MRPIAMSSVRYAAVKSNPFDRENLANPCSCILRLSFGTHSSGFAATPRPLNCSLPASLRRAANDTFATEVRTRNVSCVAFRPFAFPYITIQPVCCEL
jgi:hypothetical protein